MSKAKHTPGPWQAGWRDAAAAMAKTKGGV